MKTLSTRPPPSASALPAASGGSRDVRAWGMVNQRDVQAIQATANRWKAFQLIGWVFLLASVVIVFAAPNDMHIRALPVAIVGLALIIFGRLCAWWDYG
jgi:hypothetical protein